MQTRKSLPVKQEKFNFLEEKKISKKKKKNSGTLWDSNSANFHRIFAIQYVDHSSKPVIVVLVVSLHIYWNFCNVNSVSM